MTEEISVLIKTIQQMIVRDMDVHSPAVSVDTLAQSILAQGHWFNAILGLSGGCERGFGRVAGCVHHMAPCGVSTSPSVENLGGPVRASALWSNMGIKLLRNQERRKGRVLVRLCQMNTECSLRGHFPSEDAIVRRRDGSSLLPSKRQLLPLQSRIEKQKVYLERLSKDIGKKQQAHLEILQKLIEADQELGQPMTHKFKTSSKWRLRWQSKQPKTTKLLIRSSQGLNHKRRAPSQTKRRSSPSSQCSNLSLRCKAKAETVFRSSSWRLVRRKRRSRTPVRSWHTQCVNWKQSPLIPNLAQNRAVARVKKGRQTVSTPRGKTYLVSPAQTLKARKPSREVFQSRKLKKKRSAKQYKQEGGGLQLAPSMVLDSLYRRGSAIWRCPELVKQTLLFPFCATAKLHDTQFDEIGQAAANLTNKSVVELTPLFAQVEACRRLVGDKIRESFPYSLSLSQDIHNTCSHAIRSLPVSPEPAVRLPYTQPPCDYLSLFHDCGQYSNVMCGQSQMKCRD